MPCWLWFASSIRLKSEGAVVRENVYKGPIGEFV